jgi:hypothetical protein
MDLFPTLDGLDLNIKDVLVNYSRQDFSSELKRKKTDEIDNDPVDNDELVNSSAIKERKRRRMISSNIDRIRNNLKLRPCSPIKEVLNKLYDEIIELKKELESILKLKSYLRDNGHLTQEDLPDIKQEIENEMIKFMNYSSKEWLVMVLVHNMVTAKPFDWDILQERLTKP